MMMMAACCPVRRFSYLKNVSWNIQSSLCLPFTSYQHTFSTQAAKDQKAETLEEQSVSDNEHQTKARSFNCKPNIAEDYVTVFHRPTQDLININLNKLHFGQDAKNVPPEITLHFRKRDEVISLTFHLENAVKEKDRSEDEAVREMIGPSMKSIDELMWKEQNLDLQKLPSYYLNLSKMRLTGLVVLTAMAGYAMAPGAFDPAVFAACTIGTALTSGAANAINQFFEVPYDSQMNRTKNRVLVRGILSPLHAVGFAATSATLGVTMLALGANPLTAGLGMFNLLLYTCAYTPMKRLSIVNTWLGSIVGAIPPMMGWAACSGQLDPGAWLLGAILYAWQFPHFNALSWNLRADYSRAGYRMMSVVNPGLCKRVAFRYSVGMIGLCTLAPVLDLTTWMFAVDSLPLNLYLSYLGWRFYKEGDSKSSRKLFRFSLIHIPALLILMLISKKSYGEGNKKKPTDVQHHIQIDNTT